MKAIPSWEEGIMVLQPETEFEQIFLYKCHTIRTRIEPTNIIRYRKWELIEELAEETEKMLLEADKTSKKNAKEFKVK